MEIIRLTGDNREELDRFVMAAPDGAEFLQSFAWGEISSGSGRQILRLAAKEDGEWLAVVTLIENSLPGGSTYWYSPRGPIFRTGLDEASQKAALESLAVYLRKHFPRAIFWRLEPSRLISKIKLKKVGDIQPSQTLVLDLENDLADSLQAMHQKTRYNIRLAEKRGVEIFSDGADGLPEFLRLMEITSQRDGFRGHSSKHYQAILAKGGEATKLYLASLDNKCLAAGIFSFFGNRATYIHGASDNENREFMAPYLLHWWVMAEAKAAGCRLYDFYGIDAKKWPGVTRFKQGFGGRIVNYPGTFDYIFKPLSYRAYGLFRSLRQKIWWR